MDFIKNWCGGTNNTSDDIGANNAKDENKVKRSQIHSFYYELFKLASDSKIDRKDLRKFHTQFIKNCTLLNKAIKEKREEKIEKAENVIDEAVGAFIKYISKRKLEKNFIEIFEKYNGKLSGTLNEKIDKILNENSLSNRLNSTVESTENVSKKLIASDKKTAGSFSTSKKNAHNDENVDNSVVSKNENSNILAEEDKIKEVDAKAKEICKESTSLFKKCVSAGGNLLWWGVKAPFKCVGCVANGLWMGGCKAFEALDYSLEVIGKAKPFIDKVEKAKDVLNYKPLKKMIYNTLDMLIKKNPKGHIAMAGGKATIDTIKDMIKAGKENVGKVASFIGAKAGGLVGAGLGVVTGGVLGGAAGSGVSVVVSYIFNSFASNFLSRSENAAEKMDNELQIAILEKYCSEQDTPIGKGALTIMTALLSAGYFDDIKDEIDGKKSDTGKK